MNIAPKSGVERASSYDFGSSGSSGERMHCKWRDSSPDAGNPQKIGWQADVSLNAILCSLRYGLTLLNLRQFLPILLFQLTYFNSVLKKHLMNEISPVIGVIEA